MSFRKVVGFLLIGLGAAWVVPAHALLLGTSVTSCADSAYSGTVTADPSFCDTSGSAQPSPVTAIVTDPGSEFSLSGRTLDFSDTGLTISYSSVSSFSPDLYIFEFEPSILISGITLLTADPLNITTALNGNFLGVLVSSPLIDGVVEFGFNLNPNNVPAPAPIALLGLGLTILGLRKKR